jgi:hypothetical protein
MSEPKRRRKKLSTATIAGEEFKIYAPGFKAILRKGEDVPSPYWVADEDAVNSGYPTKTVPIPVRLGIGNMAPCDVAAAIEEECQKQQSAMLAWMDGEVDDRQRLAPKFDGTIGSLADCYESDEDSAYQGLKENSAEAYKAWLKMVRDTVGLRNVSRIVAKEFRRWYRMWKARSTSRGTDGTRQAYGGIQIVRIILNFGAESGIKKCLELRMAMDKMNFRRNPPRNVVMTFAQIRAVLEEAWRRNELFMALVQAIQFECFLRQNDVIGQWRKLKPGYVAQAGDVVIGDKHWRGMTMEMIRLEDTLVVKTSKTGKPVVHALASCQLVVECLEKIGKSVMDGPVARQADGSPWRDRQSFSKAWREIARAAGIPENVWNMDNRASGITEASEAGVPDDDIIKQSGHPQKEIMQDVYKRGGAAVSERSNATRQKHRETQTS